MKTGNTVLILLAAAAVLCAWAPSAKADEISTMQNELSGTSQSVTCTSVDQNTVIQLIFAPAQPDDPQGPQVTLMRVMDPTVSESRQEIVTFRTSEGDLANQGAHAIGYIDLNNPEVRRGERIGGTRLGSLQTIEIQIDFSYNAGDKQQKQYSGQSVYTKLSGEQLTQDFDCVLPQ